MVQALAKKLKHMSRNGHLSSAVVQIILIVFQTNNISLKYACHVASVTAKWSILSAASCFFFSLNSLYISSIPANLIHKSLSVINFQIYENP